MRWILWTPQILETADEISKEQMIKRLIDLKVIRGAADTFILEPITEQCGDDIKNDVGNDS